ncbi:MAG: HIT family protein [Alphaproteobacteria bacterium]|nr:HIT family protein [Alphaproteobacteria bacterium]
MSGFILHPRLDADTAFVVDWPLCRVLAMRDARYPWAVLVPRREAVEVFDLDEKDRAVLVEEVARAAQGLKRLSDASKINIGALGNLVPQLHVHVVARNPGDAAWPGPVWGQGTAVAHAPGALEDFVRRLVNGL